MAIVNFTSGKIISLKDDGSVNAGGKVYFYTPGTSTAKDTYPTAADAEALTNANANPLILDSAGRGTAFLNGDYKVTVKTSADVTIYTTDSINPTDTVTTTSRSSAYTLLSTDNNGVTEASGTFTLTLTAAATLGAGWYHYVKNVGSGTVTIGRANAGNTINGTAANMTLEAGQDAVIRVIAAETGFITDTGPAISNTFTPVQYFTDGIGPSYIQNIGLAVSVAAKALTVALKTKALADPSAGSPVEISFRNRTLTTGDYVVRKITAVSSIVVPSGATLGFTANEAGTVYVYVCDNGTICEVGVSKKAVFDESLLHTTTAITTGADSNNVLYTTTALTTAAVRLIGRIDITTGAVAGEWDNEDTRVYTGNNIYVGGLLFNPTGWSFIEKKTASSSTSLDFTLPAGYDAFRFTLFSIAPATDDSALYVRFSNDGGSTFLAGTGYSSSAVGRQSAGTVEAIDVSGGAQIIIGSADISDSIGNDVREALSGSITVYGALNAAVNTKLTGEITYAAASAGEVVLTVGGRYVAAEAHNAIRFFMESGNIASGIIAIEGFRTS